MHPEHSIPLLALMTSPLRRSHCFHSAPPSKTFTLNKFRWWKPNSCRWTVGVTWDVFIWLAGKKISYILCTKYVKINKSASSTSGQQGFFFSFFSGLYKAANKAKKKNAHSMRRYNFAWMRKNQQRGNCSADHHSVNSVKPLHHNPPPQSTPHIEAQSIKKNNPKGRQAPHAGNLSGMAGDCKWVVLWNCFLTKGIYHGYERVASLANVRTLHKRNKLWFKHQVPWNESFFWLMYKVAWLKGWPSVQRRVSWEMFSKMCDCNVLGCWSDPCSVLTAVISAVEPCNRGLYAFQDMTWRSSLRDRSPSE